MQFAKYDRLRLLLQFLLQMLNFFNKEMLYERKSMLKIRCFAIDLNLLKIIHGSECLYFLFNEITILVDRLQSVFVSLENVELKTAKALKILLP